MYLCYSYGEDDSIVTELSCHFRNVGITLYDSTGVITKEDLETKVHDISQEVQEESQEYEFRKDVLQANSRRRNKGNEVETVDLQKKIEAEKYVIIILTDHLAAEVMALYELDHIKRLFLKKKIRVFTIIDKRLCSKIPIRLKWILDTQLHELYDLMDLHDVVISVIECFLQDKEQSEGYYDIENIIGEKFSDSDLFIIEMMRIYHMIDDSDVRTKIMVVYSICTYLEKIYRIAAENILYYQWIYYLFQYAGQCIPSSARQISIVERCLALLFREVPAVNSRCFYRNLPC